MNETKIVDDPKIPETVLDKRLPINPLIKNPVSGANMSKYMFVTACSNFSGLLNHQYLRNVHFGK